MKKLIFVISFLLFSSTAQAIPILNPVNNNYYELITTEVGWLEAKANAEALTYMGFQGHLATVTSQNENDFISNNFSSPTQDIWLGGFQPAGSTEPAGNWQWVTGETWNYTNWFPTEPNDLVGFENHLEIRLNLASQWNDQNLNIGRYYLVEYGTPDPIPEPSTWILLGIGLIGLAGVAIKRKLK